VHDFSELDEFEPTGLEAYFEDLLDFPDLVLYLLVILLFMHLLTSIFDAHMFALFIDCFFQYQLLPDHHSFLNMSVMVLELIDFLQNIVSGRISSLAYICFDQVFDTVLG